VLYQGPARQSADAIFDTLPSVPGQLHYGPRYGLAWKAQIPRGPDRAVDVYSGLTIAGIAALSQRREPLLQIADMLANLISWFAERERNVVPDPSKTLRPDFHVGNLGDLFRPTLALPVSLSPSAIYELLEREYAPAQSFSDDSGTRVYLSVGLRRFGEMQSAADYLERVGRMSYRPEPPVQDNAGDLLAALDLASHVIAADPAWTVGPLFTVSALQPIGAVTAEVASRAEFTDRVSAMAILFGGMNVTFDEARIEAKYAAKPGPLVLLREWLTDVVVAPEARERAVDAVETIRSAIAVRVAGQHPSRETRTHASAAYVRLGIVEPIVDWGDAWDTIRTRVAHSMDVIRQEVQLSRLAEV
jgi:hypothetical protein